MMGDEYGFWVEVVYADDAQLAELMGKMFFVVGRSHSYDYLLDVDGEIVEVPIYCCTHAHDPMERP